MIYNAVGFIEESKEDIDVNRRKMMLTPILKQNILLFYSKNKQNDIRFIVDKCQILMHNEINRTIFGLWRA